MADFGRFPNMPKFKAPAARGGAKKGSFANAHNGLLPLFDDPDGRGGRRWREVFGYERRPEKPKGGKSFIAREAPKSSSDS
jgi:hypothetical protein